MKNGIVIGTIACVVAIILIGSALAPIINITTTTTTTVDNDGAVGLRMDKVSSGDFTINYGLVGDDFTATNGTDTQVIDDLCIFYADNNVAVWMDDSSIIMLGKDADNKTIDEKLSDESTITITKSSAGLEITDGTITQTFPVPTWAYVPKSTGSYGFFLNETEINTGGLPVQYVGSFAGVNCYNSINTYDLPITIDVALTGSELSGARWIKQATETAPEELNPDDLHIIPLDPSIIDIDPEPDAGIMAVPTPTYTDGVWGYDIKNVNGIDKAVIVSYSGSGGDIVVPDKVGGYDVIQFGKNTAYNNVIDYSTITDNSTITLPDGITDIGTDALAGCFKLTGTLIIPDSVTTIWNRAFENCRFSDIIVGENVNVVYAGAFSCGINSSDTTIIIKSANCNMTNSFTSTYIHNVVSFVDSNTYSNTFNSASRIKQVLNLGEWELTTTSYGLNADEVRADIPALGYLAPTQYKETVKNDGPASVLLNVIPLITIVGVLMFAVGFTIYRRNY